MSYTTDMTIDLGVFGEHDAEVQYEGQRAHPGGFDEPPTHEQFWLEAVRVKGIDLLPLIADDPYLLGKLTDEVKEHLA